MFNTSKYNSPNILRGAYKLGGRSFCQNVLKNNGEYHQICEFLTSVKDVRCHVCWQCGGSKVYDKNNILYVISRSMTLDDAKFIIEEIRKINQHP